MLITQDNQLNHWVFWSVQIASLGLLIINLNFMKKILLMLGVGLLGLALPIAGMTITPTRNLILGLAPDEAILALADKIDEEAGKNDNQEQKINELQNTLSNQQKEVEEKERLAKIKECKEAQAYCQQRLPLIGAEKIILEDNLGTIEGDRNEAIAEAEKEIKRVKKEKDSGEWSAKNILEAMDRSIERQKKKITLTEELIKKETAEKSNLMNDKCKDYKNPCE